LGWKDLVRIILGIGLIIMVFNADKLGYNDEDDI